jgi:hypothetical protein
MTTTTSKKRILKYLNRDFDGFKKDLLEHLRVYFPDTINDFNESSVGVMMTELVSFIGDNMSFYLDKKFDESFVATAKERKNLFKHAKQLGFKPFGKSAAQGTVEAFLKIPAITQNEEIIPDMRYAGVIKKGAKLKSGAGKTYETLDDIDFSKVNISDETLVAIAEKNENGKAKSFVLRVKSVPVKAGETKTKTFSVGAYEAFKKLVIDEDDVLEIIRITDSESNEWYEVDFLAQDTVFEGTANSNGDQINVPYVLRLKSVPFRFITEFDVERNRMSIIFGTGDAQNFDGDLIPDLGDLSLPLFGKDTFTDFALDPQNFLKTRTLGLTPVNTTITVKYRVGGGNDTNVGSGDITSVAESFFDTGDSTLSASVVSDVGNSFSVYNSESIQGGRDELNLEEIRSLISAHHASQSRIVSSEDFIARSLSMPSKFGSIFRAAPNPGRINTNSVELVVLSKNSNGHVTTAPFDLQTNLKTYLSRFRMLTDAIEILDGQVINVKINFGVLSSPDYNKSEILISCIEALKDFFDINKWQINQPINLTSITTLLASIPGVLSVIEIVIENMTGSPEGRLYSSTPYNIIENTKNGIIYSDVNKIFEVKYPSKDIIGLVK